MAITELALLRLVPSIDDAALRAKLVHAQEVTQKFTGRTFYYLQQVEDPALVYIIGEWDSLEQHMNEFIASGANQELLESLKDDMTIEVFFHIDVPHAELPLPKSTDAASKPEIGVTYSIARHFIKPGEKAEFQKTFEENRRYLDAAVTEGTIGGGWRVDKEEDKEEFVLWCPWTDLDQHFGFGKTEDFAKYAKIRDHIDGADIKHAKILEI